MEGRVGGERDKQNMFLETSSYPNILCSVRIGFVLKGGEEEVMWVDP